jgi:hypothetical protein
MDLSMTARTQRDQVQLRIRPALTTKLLMMDLEIGHRAAELAAPAISPKHLLAQILIGFGFEP